MKNWIAFFFLFAGSATAQIPAANPTNTTSFAETLLALDEFEAAGDAEAGLRLIAEAKSRFLAAGEAKLLARYAQRLNEQKTAALEIDAAMKSLAKDRDGSLEDAQNTLRHAREAGRRYLRAQVQGGGELEAELAAETLAELGDPNAAELFLYRMQHAHEWSVFLMPLLKQVEDQLIADHLPQLIDIAQRDNRYDPIAVNLIFDLAERYAGDPQLRERNREKEPNWPLLATHLNKRQQNSLVSFLIRLLDDANGTKSPEQVARAEHLLTRCNLIPAQDAALRGLSGEHHERWLKRLKEMTITPRMIAPLASVVSAKGSNQVEVAEVLLDSLCQAASPGTAPKGPRKKMPAEVASLSYRLTPAEQSEVVRAGLAFITQHDGAAFEDLLAISQFDALPEILVDELSREHRDRFIDLTLRISDQWRSMSSHKQNQVIDQLLAWAQAHPGDDEQLKAARVAMLKSRLPGMPAQLAGKLTSTPDGTSTDWLMSLCIPLANKVDPYTLRSLASHAANSGAQWSAASQWVIAHLEQLAWEPENPPSRVREGQSRFERLPVRLKPDSFGDVGRTLTQFVQKTAGDENVQDWRARAELLILESGIPTLPTHLVNTFAHDPTGPAANSQVSLLAGMGHRLGELSEAHQANLVIATMKYVDALGEAEAKNERAAASRLLRAGKFIRSSELLTSRLQEMKSTRGLDWTLMQIKAAPGLDRRNTLLALSEKARSEGPWQGACSVLLMDGLEKRCSEKHPTDLALLLKSDVQDHVIHTLLGVLTSLYNGEQTSTAKREIQRLERLLPECRLPQVPRETIAAIQRAPDAPAAESLMKLLVRMKDQLRNLDDGQTNTLLDTTLAFMQTRLNDDKKSIAATTGQVLYDAHLVALPEKMAAKLARIDRAPEAQWLAQQLTRIPYPLDDNALIRLSSLAESGGKNESIAMQTLATVLLRWAGENTPENLQVLLNRDVQDAVGKAAMASVKRHGAEASQAQRLLRDGALFGTTKRIADAVISDPTGERTPIWLGLLIKQPERLQRLSETDQSRLSEALIRGIGSEHAATQQAATLLANAQLLKRQLSQMISTVNRAPDAETARRLVPVLNTHAPEFRHLPQNTRNELASGLLKVSEAFLDDTSVRAQVTNLLGRQLKSTLDAELVNRLAKPKSPELLEWHTALLRAMSTQVTPATMKKLQALAETEGPNQETLKRLERHIAVRYAAP